MKEIIIIIIILIVLLLGINEIKKPQVNTSTNIKELKNNIEYFKDERTGLCFAVISSSISGYATTSNAVSITCVPCDSIKKTFIK
jgi:regulatory protein YycI of two-component signal transduction system YycFG